MAQKQLTRSISLAIREMQIKTTLTLHLITVSEWLGSKQMTVMLVRMWGKGNTYLLLVEVQTCTSNMEISVEILQKAENRAIKRSNHITLGHIPQRFF